MFKFRASESWRSKLSGLLTRHRDFVIPREELETLLHEADFSTPVVERLIQALQKTKAADRASVLSSLSAELARILIEVTPPPKALTVPSAILLLGVNGVGKTTSAGKLAHYFRTQQKEVVLAAADTFRTGAVDQLRHWASQTGSDFVSQSSGADPASVIYDAWQKAISRNAVLIADTAGRMHTKQPLVEELKKMVRVLNKDGRGAPHESYLVLDATTGQNLRSQSQEFSKAIPLTGLILTKLEGTAKGGSAISSSLELSLPIRYIGVGEKAEDFLPFDVKSFADEIFHE